MKLLVLIFLFIVILICIKFLPNKEKMIDNKIVNYKRVPDRFNYRSKCFTCEQQITDDYGNGRASLGMPTRCYSCQQQMMEDTNGYNGGFDT